MTKLLLKTRLTLECKYQRRLSFSSPGNIFFLFITKNILFTYFFLCQLPHYLTTPANNCQAICLEIQCVNTVIASGLAGGQLMGSMTCQLCRESVLVFRLAG